MRLSLLLVIKAILFLIAGAALVLIPTTVLSWYGATADLGTLYTVQLFGAAFLLIAFLAWAVSGVPELAIQRNIAIAAFLGDAVGFAVALINQFAATPAVNSLGWLNVAVFLLLAVGFAYFVLFETNLFGIQARRPVTGAGQL